MDAAVDRARLARLLFIATLAVWATLPILLRPHEATDITPYLVADDLAADGHVGDVYVQEDGEISERFRATACPYSDEDCVAFPFVSTPSSLPVGTALRLLSVDVATLLVRALMTALLIAAMVVLWRRVADASPSAALNLALATALCTPLAVVTISSGNNTPLMVLLAALPLARLRSRRAEVLIGLSVGLSIVFKAFPVVLAGVAAAWRRWRIVVWAAVGVVAMTVLTLLVAAPSLFTEFVISSTRWTDTLKGGMANGSVAAGLTELVPGAASSLIWLSRLGVVALAVALYRRLAPEHLWVCAMPVALLAWPQVWVAYNFFTVVAVVVLAPLRDRLWLLPLVAATTIPASIAIHESFEQPLLYSGPFLAGWLVLAAALPRAADRAEAPEAPATVPALT